MDEDTGSWRDRCERYFTSMSNPENRGSGEEENEEKEKLKWKEVNDITKARPKRKNNFELLKKWTAEVDIHGTSIAARSGSVVEFVVWILVIFISVGAFLFLVFLNVDLYLDRRLTFTVSSVKTSRQLPNLTVCHLNKLKRSAVNGPADNRFKSVLDLNSSHITIGNYPLQKSSRDVLEASTIASVMDGTLSPAEITRLYSVLDGKYRPFSKMKSPNDWGALGNASALFGEYILRDAIRPSKAERRLLGPRGQDMILRCTLDGDHCPENIIEDTETEDEGMCMTISAGKATDKGDLDLLLNVEPREHIDRIDPTVGVKVIVHHNTSPDVDSREYLLQPGAKTVIALKKREVIRRKASCNEAESYNLKNCLASCIDAFAQSYCSCRLLDEEASTMCQVNNQFQFTCLQAVLYLVHNEKIGCNCPTPCNTVIYDTDLTMVQWPSDGYVEQVRLYLRHSKNISLMPLQIREAVSHIVVKGDQVQNVVMDEVYTDTLVAFMARIGGYLALLTGASVLTVLQVTWLLIRLCFHGCSKLRSKESGSIQKFSESEFTSVTWTAYKAKRKGNKKCVDTEDVTDIQTHRRQSSRRSSNLAPIFENKPNIEKNRMYTPNNHGHRLQSNNVFYNKAHNSSGTSHGRVINSVDNGNRSRGAEFPLFNTFGETVPDNVTYPHYFDAIPHPRCSTPDNSDIRSTTRLFHMEGDPLAYPSRGRIVSPMDAIQMYGHSARKYYYYDHNYL